MPLTLVTIRTKLEYPNGDPAVGAHVVAELQSPAQYDDGYVVPKKVEGIVDENGEVSINLWPNDLGKNQSFYKIVAHDKVLGEILKVVTVVPESPIPLELEDISMPLINLSLANTSGNVASIRRVETDEGLTGGGDLSTNRTHSLDLSTISTQEIKPTLDMVVAVQNRANPGQIRWANLGDLPGVGPDIEEPSIATVGQTEILVEQEFGINTGAIDLFISGKYQCEDTYDQEDYDVAPYNGKLRLPEPLEGGEKICVKIKKTAAFSSSSVIDASAVTYSGTGGDVEDALDSLFSLSAATPWTIVSTSKLLYPGDRVFVTSDSGPVTLSLPEFPSVGDTVRIIDITSLAFIGAGNSLINDITIDRNGSPIMEFTENLIIDQAKVSLEFIYSGPTVGWVFSE